MTPYQQYLIEQALEEEYLEEGLGTALRNLGTKIADKYHRVKDRERGDTEKLRHPFTHVSGSQSERLNKKLNTIQNMRDQYGNKQSYERNPIRSRGGRANVAGSSVFGAERDRGLSPLVKNTPDVKVASRNERKNRKNQALKRGSFAEQYYLEMIDILAESGYLETTDDLYALAEAALYLLED